MILFVWIILILYTVTTIGTAAVVDLDVNVLKRNKDNSYSHHTASNGNHNKAGISKVKEEYFVVSDL